MRPSLYPLDKFDTINFLNRSYMPHPLHYSIDSRKMQLCPLLQEISGVFHIWLGIAKNKFIIFGIWVVNRAHLLKQAPGIDMDVLPDIRDVVIKNSTFASNNSAFSTKSLKLTPSSNTFSSFFAIISISSYVIN